MSTTKRPGTAVVVDPRHEHETWVVGRAMVELPGARASAIQAHLLTFDPPVVLSVPQIVTRMRQVWVWWRERRLALIDDMVAGEVAKLDRLEAELWPMVVGADLKKKDMDAVGRLLQISERRSKLLGLDAPARSQQQSVNVHIVRGPEVTGPAEPAGMIEGVPVRQIIEATVVGRETEGDDE